VQVAESIYHLITNFFLENKYMKEMSASLAYYYNKKNDVEFMKKRREYSKQYYKKNKEKLKKYQREKRKRLGSYFRTDEARVAHIKYCRKYYKKHKYKLLEKQRTLRNLGKNYFRDKSKTIKIIRGKFVLTFN